MDLSTLLATAPPASSRHSLPLSASSSAAHSPSVSRRNSVISAVSSRRGSMRAGESSRQFSVTVSPATDHVAEAAAAAAAAASSTRPSSPPLLQISLPSSPPTDSSTTASPSPPANAPTAIVVSPPAAAASSHRRNRSAAMSLPPDVPLAAAAAAASTTVTAAAASSSVRTAPVSTRSSLTVAAPATRRSSMPRGSSFLSSAAGRLTPTAAPGTPPLSALGSSPKSRPSSAATALSIPGSPSMASSSSSSTLGHAAAATASSVAHRRVASSMTPSAAASAAAATAASLQKRPSTVKVPSTTSHRPGSARSASLAAATAKAAAATAAAAAAAKALAAAKAEAASHFIAPTTNDYSLLLHSPMGRATTTAAPFMRPRSASTATAAAASTPPSSALHGRASSRPSSAAPAAAPVSASSLLPRSASFGSLSTAAVPAWLLAEVLARADAQRQFEVTALQAEKAALVAQLEEARLTISDLRYQGYRKDAAADLKISRHLEMQRSAERARDAWGSKYLWARRVIHAHKVLLLHVGIQAFLRAYMSKRNMLGLATSMRGLVAVIDRSKDDAQHDLSNRLAKPLPQAETRAFVEDGRALWQSVVRTPSSVLLQNLQDGLLSLRTSLLSTLALKRTVSHTIESMFARNQELVATNLALREDLDALTPECADGKTKSPQLWKRPGLLRQVLRRMDLEERESARTAAAEALRVKRELELKAILAPNIAATKRSRRTIGGQGWASQVYVEAADSSLAAAATAAATSGGADRPSSAASAAGRFTPKPPPTAAAVAAGTAQNGISTPARFSGSPHFVARPMPRTSTVARVELSSKGIAYRHAAPTRANKQPQQQEQRQAEPLQPPPLADPASAPTEDAEWSPPQPSWARHFRHSSFSSHRIPGHARTPSSALQLQQQQSQQQQLSAEEHKTQHAPASAPISARRAAPAVPSHKRSILDVVAVAADSPDDDQMMLGWRDDDSDEETTDARAGARASREAHAPSSSFSGPTRGLARFRSAVHRVLHAERSKYRSMKGALHELKHMDLGSMHLDPDVD